MPPGVILDVRETRLAAALTAQGTKYQTANLDVGDFLIQTEEGEPLLIAERKSHADFASSNQDGRYREQRARLMAARGSGVAVLYVLEGTWTADQSRSWGRTTENQLRRLTTRLILRYGMPVLFSDSIQGTAQWCATLLSQLMDDATVFQPEEGLAAATTAAMTGLTAALSTTKKGNKTATSTAAAMLSAIPGLGGKRVTAMLESHSIADLVSLTEAELSTLVVGGKRLGVLGPVIYAALRSKAA